MSSVTNKKTQHWIPMTCGCEIEFEFDAGTDWQNIRVIAERTDAAGNVRKTILCANHAGVPLSDIHATVWDEHKRKEFARAYILANISTVTTTLTAPDGTAYKDFKPGITFQVTFTGADKNRIVNVSLPGAPANTFTNTIKTAFNTMLVAINPLWSGKVILT